MHGHTSEDDYVALEIVDGATILTEDHKNHATVQRGAQFVGKSIKPVRFIPYYFRAERGGRGHMRVALHAGAHN
jgi:uncharacterized protein